MTAERGTAGGRHMARRVMLVTFSVLLSAPCLYAQKKELSEAKSYIKSGKDYDKAETLMTDLLSKDSASRQNPKVYLTLYQALQKQYESGNEKLYLKEKYDTASLFSLTKKMYGTLETLDSIDALPDKKGRTETKYRKKHAGEIGPLRPNLYNGGTYYLKKDDYKTAYGYFEEYIDCAAQPLFDGYVFPDSGRHNEEAAYWATFCGHKQKDADMTLKHAGQALADTARRKFTYMHIAEAYKQKGNDSLYVKTLHDGFNDSPSFLFFFAGLMDYYKDKERTDSMLSITERALNTDGRNKLFLFARSTVLLDVGKNEECMTVCDTLISICDTLAEPYFNAGIACLNIILNLEDRPAQQKDKEKIRSMYTVAQTYMEKYRALAPDEKDKWAFPLYRIYLNLNEGDKFDEIDKILKK